LIAPPFPAASHPSKTITRVPARLAEGLLGGQQLELQAAALLLVLELRKTLVEIELR